MDLSNFHKYLLLKINHIFFQTVKLYIDPSNKMQFPGIHTLKTKLKSWEWRFGKTPPFSISKQHNIVTSSNQHLQVVLNLNITKGCVETCRLHFRQRHIDELSQNVDYATLDIDSVIQNTNDMCFMNITAGVMIQLEGKQFDKLELLQAMQQFRMGIQSGDKETIELVYETCCDIIRDVFT